MVYVSMFWISIKGEMLYRQPKGLSDFTWLLVQKYDKEMYFAYFGQKQGCEDIDLRDRGRIMGWKVKFSYFI